MKRIKLVKLDEWGEEENLRDSYFSDEEMHLLRQLKIGNFFQAP